MWLAKLGKGMLFTVEQAFVGTDERQAPLKTPAWEATPNWVIMINTSTILYLLRVNKHTNSFNSAINIDQAKCVVHTYNCYWDPILLHRYLSYCIPLESPIPHWSHQIWTEESDNCHRYRSCLALKDLNMNRICQVICWGSRIWNWNGKIHLTVKVIEHTSGEGQQYVWHFCAFEEIFLWRERVGNFVPTIFIS